MQDTPALAQAQEFVADAYRQRLRRRGRTVDHPRAAAALLADDGQAEPVVLAGLLHDVLEDCDISAAQLEQRFGAQVARLVEAVTQDPMIGDYRERKAALRRKTVDAGPEAASIALADKLSKVRAAATRPRRRKLAHYWATLEEIEARHGRSPLSRALRATLDRWPQPAPG